MIASPQIILNRFNGLILYADVVFQNASGTFAPPIPDVSFFTLIAFCSYTLFSNLILAY